MEPGTPIGQYRIEGLLGRGGMGAVYRATDTETGDVVAIKMLLSAGDEDALARFTREVRIMRSLRHPNIVSFRDCGVFDDKVYVVMQYIQGTTFEEALAARTIDKRQALIVLLKVARALQVAHDAGVLHRDVKPANILLHAESGEPVLLDFGLGRIDTDAKGLTAAGLTMGSPEYMSPEQALGYTDQVDARSDVYSLGVILYQVLTGQKPFRGRTPVQVIMAVATGKSAPPSQVNARVPAEVEAVCVKAMATTKDERYPTPLAFADALTRGFSDARKPQG